MSHVGPYSCPIFVGRDTESVIGADLLTRAAARHGGMLVVAGEAGVGKSRLTQGLGQTAAWRGFQHLIGYCHERDRDLPYAPFLDVLHAMMHQRDKPTLKEFLEAERAILGRLLPALAPDDAMLAPLLAPADEKHRILEAFVALFTRFAADVPLLLIIEDIHWADEASLDLLRLLARRLADAPVLMVVTVRTNEPNSNLIHWLDYLERNRFLTRVNLAPLSAPDVTRMIAAMTDTLPSPTAVRTIQERAEGIPLLVEELLYAQKEAAEMLAGPHVDARHPAEQHVPAVIVETVARRLDALDVETRWIAEAAAAIGQRFSFDLLRRLTGRKEEHLLVALRQLVAAYLIEQAPEEGHDFVFRHALTRDAIYGRLLGPERQRLHRRVARALITTSGKQHAAPESALGYHAFLAGEWELALEHCQRAGEQAQALYAPHAAVEHFSRALIAGDRLGRSDAELLLHRGQAYEWMGEIERARDDDERALAIVQANGDRSKEWRILIQLGTLWFGRDYAQSHAFYQRAYALAQAANDPAALARSLISLGRWCQVVDRPDDALRYEEEALTIFTASGDSHGIAQTMERLGYASYFGGDQMRSAAWHRQALARCEETHDRRGLVMNLLGLAQCTATLASNWIVPAHTPIATCLPDGERARALARESGWPYGEAHALTFLSFIAGAEGKYATALSWATEGMMIGEEIEHRTTQIFAHCALGVWHHDLFALRVAQRHLERALALAQELHAPFYILSVTGLLVSLHLTENDLAQAEAVFNAAFSPDIPMRTHGQRRIWLAQAELTCARGDPGRALDLIEEMIATAPNNDRTPHRCIPRLDLTRAEALTALGRDSDAARVLMTAIEVARAQGARPLLWRLQHALGGLHDRHGRTREAARAFDAARLLIEDLAATVPDEHTAGTFQRHALATVPRSYRTASYQAIKQQYGGLTAREREVVARVARGLTNREIADMLFITEKTIELHVTHSLRKLGFRARTELATWAVTAGLADVPLVARRAATPR